jgi:hypothetical protein
MARRKPRGRRGSPARRKRALATPLERSLFWLGWWATCFGLWMLLVFKTELAEVALGAVAAALAATGAELVRSHGYTPFLPELRWWRRLLRLPREVTVDMWLMTRALARHALGREQIDGRFRIVHFEGGASGDPRAEARRAAAKWLGCVSPNTYVVGFDERSKVAVVHQLVPAELPPDVDPSQ